MILINELGICLAFPFLGCSAGRIEPGNDAGVLAVPAAKEETMNWTSLKTTSIACALIAGWLVSSTRADAGELSVRTKMQRAFSDLKTRPTQILNTIGMRTDDAWSRMFTLQRETTRLATTHARLKWNYRAHKPNPRNVLTVNAQKAKIREAKTAMRQAAAKALKARIKWNIMQAFTLRANAVYRVNLKEEKRAAIKVAA